MFTIDPRQAAKVAIPDTGQKTLFLDESDSVLKTKDDAGVVEALAVADATEPKVYVALLTQTETDAPAATVLKNTLGGTVVWSYVDVGEYNCTLSGTFDLQKTFAVITNNVDEVRAHSRVLKIDEDTVKVRTGEYSFTAPDTFEFVPINGYLQKTSIKIEVYP